MLIHALSDPLIIGVLAAVVVMICLATGWSILARRQSEVLRGALAVLQQVGRDLPREHLIRKRLGSAPIVDVSFEEIAHLPMNREDAKDAKVAVEELVK